MSHSVPFSEAVRTWWHIALFSFGGPAGQIALMHRKLVEEKRWIGEQRFLHAVNFCMLLPGPEAQQLAIYIGWLLHKTKGGLVAGILFIVPGAVAIMILSIIYALFGNAAPVAALFFGLKAAVLALVFQAVIRIGSRSLTSMPSRLIAFAAFVALFVFAVPFPVLIIAAAAIGWFVRLPASGHGGAADRFPDSASALGESIPAHAQLKGWPAMRFPLILLVLWLLPTAILAAWLGPDNRFSEIAQYFSRMAVLTFGGAYAVLAWVGQAAVEQFQWLSATEMLDGLGLAETTPGPLIMVTQYVGFLAAFREPGSLSPLAAGVAGGLLTTWVTFVPCFIWIFAGAPYVERLRANVALASSLAAITAAVVGVILNLALWFAFHYLFLVQQEFNAGRVVMTLPSPESLDLVALFLSIGATVALFRFKISPIKTLMGCALAGMVIKLAL